MSKHAAPKALAVLASNLFSRLWWAAATKRALRTALTIAVPYVAAAGLFREFPWVAVGSTVVLGAIASLLFSLTGLTEAGPGTVPLWLALLERVVKTFAQAVLAGIGTATLLQEVDWAVILQTAIFAALGSLLLGVLTTLPEAAPPIDARETNVITVLSDAEAETSSDGAPIRARNATLVAGMSYKYDPSTGRIVTPDA